MPDTLTRFKMAHFLHLYNFFLISLIGSEGLCGNSLPSSDFTTENDQFMPIEFTTDGSNQIGSFEITLTNFHTGMSYSKTC